MPSPWGFLLYSAHLHMYTSKFNPEGGDLLLRISDKPEL